MIFSMLFALLAIAGVAIWMTYFRNDSQKPREVSASNIVPVVTATILGGMLGVTAGFLGGRVNMAIMRTVDIFYAFPSVLLAVAISGTMGGGMSNGLIALTLVFIPPLCRIAETATTQVRNLDFVEAARASGAPTRSIIVHHILGKIGRAHV